MQFPRHNVPHYTANAVWDARSMMSVEVAVASMLGDPFGHARSVYMDVLRLVFSGFEREALKRIIARTWPADEKYAGNPWAVATRWRLLEVLSGMDHDYVRRSAVWDQLPAWLRTRLGDQGPFALRGEAAECAAALVMDIDFASRDERDIWKRELLPDLEVENMHRAYGAQPSFWSGLFTGGESEADQMDPHSVVYATVYQTHASGWYGGNLTLVFSQADAPWGNGIDRSWLDKGCAGPKPPWKGMDEWRNEFCWQRDDGWGEDGAAQNPDAGEIRTPNYKRAEEIDGVLTYEWHDVHDSQEIRDDMSWSGDDVSSLVLGIKWAFFRHNELATAEQTDGAGERHGVVIVLAPWMKGRVFGVERHCCPERFTATPGSPTLGWDQTVPGDVFSTADLPGSTGVVIPAWGALHRCSRSNLPAGGAEADPPSGADRASLCAAVRALRPLASQLSPAERTRLCPADDCSLPDNLVKGIRGLRLWPPDATLDLSQSDAVQSRTPQDQVCVLSLARLRAVEEAAVCGPPPPTAPSAAGRAAPATGRRQDEDEDEDEDEEDD